MKYDIEQLEKLEAFSDIDRHIASYLSSVKGGDSPLFFLMVMLLSRCIEKGDVCLSLERVAAKSLSWLSAEDPDNAEIYETITLPGIDGIVSCLKKSAAAGTESDRLPLILSGSRLYFHRYMVYENELASMINNLCVETSDLPPDDELVPLFRGFFPAGAAETDMQAWAAAVSLRRRFSVISGGPGTGKTSSVVRIINLITEARRMKGLSTNVALTAPTGKAAARLAAAAADFNSKPGSLPVEPRSFTLHRLLGYNGHSGFRHGIDNPVDYDVVVADECSMADLPLLHRFFSALKKDSRLILLGDRDQLASVEGGAVFGDICGSGSASYSGKHAESCSILTGGAPAGPGGMGAGVKDSITFLTKSWRFGPESGIGALASAVKRGDSDEAVRILGSGAYADLHWDREPSRATLADCISGAADRYAAQVSPGYEAVKMLTSSFCILTALRRGPAGMETMNYLAESVLSAMEMVDPSVRFYDGRPVMVTGNDYALKLFNGDIGIIRRDENGSAAVFHAPDAERSVSCGRLPVHETAYAMTIHKSQGSEFDEVLVVLPQQWNRVMTRELLYTAVTRGKTRVIISGNETVIRQMVCTGTERMSGLRGKLHPAT